jgi:hypothetical protein
MSRRDGALLWFGVLGAPSAWALQHVTGYALSEAACREAGRLANPDPWTIAVSAAAAAIAVLATVASVVVWRATRDAGNAPPAGRVHFMAVIGMTVAPLFLALVLMSGTGAVVLEGCVQS